MLFPEVRSTLESHGANRVLVGLLDLFVRETLRLPVLEEPDVEGRLDLIGGIIADRGEVVRKLAMAGGIAHDLCDLVLAVSEPTQSCRDSLVDDLEEAATGQLLELHHGEIGLDAGRVAVHDEANGAGRARPPSSARFGSRVSHRAG
jgi:hypothetical protein